VISDPAPNETRRPFARFLQIATSPHLTAAVAMLLWAFSTIVARYVRDDVPPMGLSFWRTALAFVILLPFVAGRLRTHAEIILRHWKILFALGAMLILGGNAMLFLALQYTIAINAAVLNSTEPVIIIVVAWLLFRDPVGWPQAAGITLSLIGVLALIGRGDLDVLARLDFNQGDLIVMAAYVSWAFYAVLLRRAPRELDHLTTLALILGFGSVALFPVYLIEEFAFRPTYFTWTALISMVILAVLSSLLGLLMWNRAVTALGPGRAGIYIHLIPAYTIVLAIVLLGETLELFHIAGIALIATGIAVSSRGRAGH
jgi:drug/metabolite transporter (DMT)-like permease